MNIVRLNKLLRCDGFTLAEMMVVLLVLSLTLAAFIPVITKQNKTSSSLWKFSSDQSSVYYGTGDTQGVSIGTSTFASSDNARLLLQTVSSGTQNDIIFKQQGTYVGNLLVNGASSSNANSVGLGNTKLGTNSTAMGTSAYATGTGSVAVGYGTTASNPSSVAIGVSNNTVGAAGDRSVAIGANANVSAANSIAFGSNTTVTTAGSMAIGTDSAGTGASTTAANQIVLGTASHTVYIPGNLTIGGTITATGLSSGSLSGNNYVVVNTSNGVFFKYSSDKRLKNIKGDFSDGLNKLLKLKPYKFIFKDDKSHTLCVGVIAQDLQKVFPNAVSKGPKGYLLIRTDEILYSAVNSIKELDKMVLDLRKKIDVLSARLKQAEDKIIAIVNFNKTAEVRIKSLEKQNKILLNENKRTAARYVELNQRLSRDEKLQIAKHK